MQKTHQKYTKIINQMREVKPYARTVCIYLIDDLSSKHMLAMTDFIRLDPHLFLAKSLF